MATLALTFPGQGSQRPGMGRPWRDTPEWALVEQASAATGRDLAALLLDADAETLRAPREAQISTFVTSLLALGALRRTGVLDGHDVIGVAGHSLGEYTALVAAGVLTSEAGLRLVAERGEAMQAAAQARPGTMAAVLGADADAVARACADVEAWPANDNGPGHIVVSGTHAGVEAAGQAAKAEGARRVVPIPVGGAYHTPLMEPARDRLAAALDATAYSPADPAVWCNVDAAPHTAATDFPDLLARQLTAPVRWREILAALVGAGAQVLVEVGPGGVLTGLAKRGAPEATAYAVSGPEDVPQLQEALA